MHETAGLRNFVGSNPRQKKTRTPAGLAIASIAIAEDAIIATGNVGHFGQIHQSFPIPGIYNPFKAEWSIPPANDDGCGV
jgi:hypothetical protein